MLENQDLYVIFEKTNFSYDSCFDSFNIKTERRQELENKDIVFIPRYYRDIKQPCFTEGLSESLLILKNELDIKNVDLCKNKDEGYLEFQMHSALVYLGTIVSNLALGLLTNIIYDLIKKQYCAKSDDIVNFTIINPTINVKIDYNGQYSNIKKLPEQYITYSKSGIEKSRIALEGKLVDVTA